MALRLFGIKFLPPERTYSSLQIAKFPFAYCGLKIIPDFQRLSGVVSKDHVHIVVSAPPNIAPSEIMRRIKGRSARKLFEEFPKLKKRYWGKRFWARGYFCVRVGQMTEEMIKNYLEHHFEANPNDNFKTEYSEHK